MNINLLKRYKNRKNNKENKKRRKELEKNWVNLISDEEKLFYDPCHFSALEDAVSKKIKNRNEIDKFLIEVNFLHRQAVDKFEASSQIGVPSILSMTSGAFLVYSIMFQLPINEEYDIKKVQDGFKLLIPDGDVGKTLLLLAFILFVIFFAVAQMSKTYSKNHREVCYYENLLKVLNKKKDSNAKKECTPHYTNDSINSSVSFIVILHCLKKIFKRNS